MEKKAVVILIILAILLIAVAITIETSSPKEIGTKYVSGQGSSGKIGVTVLPPQIEDKLSGNTNG